MKIIIQVGALLLFTLLCTSFINHKFYMSIYQVNYVLSKKRIEVTARLFLDDVNMVLEKKYLKKTALGLINETKDDEIILKKYIADHVIFIVNGSQKELQFVSKEVEDNVLICYFKITDISKINSLKIKNNAFLEQFIDQQNLIQSTIYGQKNSTMLHGDAVFATLK